jgi:Anti-sigma-K factor rskA
MSTHIHDELPLLLTGEADRATVNAAAVHLRECEDCQHELISALGAHASLSSAAKFAPETASPTGPAEPSPIESATELPDLSSMFTQVRDEARSRTPAAAGSRRWRTRWLAAAAVAGLAAGGGAVTVAQHIDHGPSSRTVALAAFDQGARAASAKIVGSDEIRVDATTLPSLPQGKRYEVWLTDAARQHLQPLGWVGTNGRSNLTVPPDLMNRFSAVEVSVQDVNAPYLYSGISVLRGSYR